MTESHRTPPRATTGPDSASGLLRQGAAALQSGQAEEAARLAREALLRAPAHRGARYLLGLALLAAGEAEAAIGPLRSAAEGNSDPAIETNLGTALMEAERHDEALGVLHVAASRVPPFPAAFLRLGLLLEMLERPAEAEAALRRAVELAPNEAAAWAALGRVLAGAGALNDAEAAFTRALAARPGFPDALQGLAQLHIDRGDYARAEEFLRELRARAPDRIAAWFGLAFCLQELGRFDDAIVVYRELIAIDPRFYRQVLGSMVDAARGRFWHKPSKIAEILGKAG